MAEVNLSLSNIQFILSNTGITVPARRVRILTNSIFIV